MKIKIKKENDIFFSIFVPAIKILWHDLIKFDFYKNLQIVLNHCIKNKSKKYFYLRENIFTQTK